MHDTGTKLPQKAKKAFNQKVENPPAVKWLGDKDLNLN